MGNTKFDENHQTPCSEVSTTSTTMTGTNINDQVDCMEFFPSERSDSGLLQEIIQGFFPKENVVKSQPPQPAAVVDTFTTSGVSDVSGLKKRIGDAAYFDCHVPLPQHLENFAFGVQSQPIPFYNEYHHPVNNVQASQECMLGWVDGFQYPDLLGAFAAEIQNA
ncbi:hypothetical protein ACH5RR_035579 [Cinchona calisaya]|uniref:Uncharacterized protein n=1 Tax=Cinchona calisaya TaxID=153742 RepID=A0ABD2Y5N8_9GENT